MKKFLFLNFYFFLFLFTFVVSSCTKLASDFDTNSSIEEIIKTAEQAYNKKDYTRAAEIYLTVNEFYPYSDTSRIALIKAIRSYHSGAKFNELRKTSKKYLDLYPNDQNSSFAKYMIGMSYFEQIIDVERDQGATRDSIREFNELINLYPRSKYSEKAKENIVIAKSQLAGQEVAVGRYYLNKNNPLSAINRFQTVIDYHKNTAYYPEAIFRSIEAYAMLGISDKILSYAYRLKKEFPDSEWNKLAFVLIKEYGIKVD
tara:strand:- start:139 stop:912 length:774 start_codon:yes stop_codon:yes gene_type:complete